MYYCTYCAFYERVYLGTRADVVEHAEEHPIGDPDEMSCHILAA